jgi:hypothetical protein
MGICCDLLPAPVIADDKTGKPFRALSVYKKRGDMLPLPVFGLATHTINAVQNHQPAWCERNSHVQNYYASMPAALKY